jgi:tetratricopeptide (TPR) repeat protein
VAARTPLAFLSYAHFNDQHDGGHITALVNRLAGEVQAQTGEEFPIFVDRNDIRWGEQWRQRIEESIDSSVMLIPVITPSYFNSAVCQEEINRFLDRERRLNRGELILPIYYISCPQIDGKTDTTPIAEELRRRQYFDWRALRGSDLASTQAVAAIRKMAEEIRERLKALDSAGAAASLAASATNLLGESLDYVLQPNSEPHGPPHDEELLPQLRHFVGREDEVTWLTEQLMRPQGLASLHGLPGIGKTALAAEAVHRLVAEGAFPDGVAVIRCANSPNPVESLRLALSRFHPFRHIPVSTSDAELGEIAKQMLTGKQALIVLDGIPPDAQFDNLLQTLQSSGATLLVTSQRTFPSHVIPKVARRMVGAMSHDAGYELFTYNLGRWADGTSDLTEAEKTAVDEILSVIDFHPLAIEVMSAYAGDLQLDLVRLATPPPSPQRVLEIPRGEYETVIEDVLAKSIDSLDTDTQRVLAALAVFETLDFSRPIAHKVANELVQTNAERCLNMLVLRNLLNAYVNTGMSEISDRDRLRFHPLIHAYVAKAFARLIEESLLTIKRTIIRYYQDYLLPEGNGQPTDTRQNAEDVFDSAISPDVNNIVLALEWAYELSDDGTSDEQYDRSVAVLCSALQYYWRRRGQYDNLTRYLPWGIAAAERLEAVEEKDTRFTLLRSRMAVSFAMALLSMGQLDRADPLLRENLDLRRQMGDYRGAAAILHALGTIAEERGDIDQAASLFAESLTAIIKAQNQVEEVIVLHSLGSLELGRDNRKAAKGHLERALRVARKADSAPSIATLLLENGRYHLMEDQLPQADQMLAESLSIAEEYRLRGLEPLILHMQGQVERKRRRVNEAMDLYEKSLELARDLGGLNPQAVALHAIGTLLLESSGDLDRAEACFRESLSLFRTLHDMRHEGMQIASLGSVALARKDLDLAESYLHQALVIAQTVQNINDQGAILLRLGQIAHTRGQFVEAKSYYLQSLPLLRKARRLEEVTIAEGALDSLA